MVRYRQPIMNTTLRINALALLRWSEKYTKTDMVYLTKGGGWFLLGTIISLVISTISFLAFANLLTKENYGAYQYILSVADLFGIFALNGIDTAVARSVARGKDGSIREGLVTKIRWGLIGGVGAIILGTYYLARMNPTLGWGFIIAGLFIPFWEAPGMFTNYLQGKKRFDLFTLGDAATQFCVAAIIVPALFFTNSILVILTLYLLVFGLARTFFYFFSLWMVPPNTIPDPEMIPYGKNISFMSIIATAATSADTILLWHLLGPAPVAIYTFSQSIPGRAAGFLKIINRLAFPKMAAQDADVIRNTLMSKILSLLLISSICALAYVIAAPFLFAFFLPRYVEAVPYTMLAAMLIALQPFSLIPSSFTAQAKTQSLYIWSITAPAMRIALFVTLIPQWGLWGAIIGLVTAKALESILLTVLFYRS